MQIDWLTVSAQIVNFLVLAWLLHRFLYGPITRAMERREQRIAQRLEDAQQMRVDAESEGLAFRRERDELAQRRDQFFATARQEAEDERRRLYEESRADIEAQKAAWFRDLQEQRAAFLSDIRERAKHQFCTLARRALKDLADARLEDQMTRVFCRKLRLLDPEAKRRMGDAAGRADGIATVRSGFEASRDAKEAIAHVIQDEILANARVVFEPAPDVLRGLELKMGGQTIAWTLDSYMNAFENLIDQDFADRFPHPE